MAIDTKTFAPKWDIVVAKESVGLNISRYVRSVEYESADGMADVAKIRLDNPGDIISNSKMFQPGNEFSVFMGYGEQVSLTHIGRVVIMRQVPDYPQDGMPTLGVTGYTKDCKMMENEPENSKDRRFTNAKFSDAVGWRAATYEMEIDIDDTEDKPHNFIQKAGLSDYEFIQGLANINGYVFWVDGDEDGKWTLHFRNPDTIQEQDKTYTFKYSEGDLSSLLSFRPEMLIKDSLTKISVVSKDRATGRVVKTEVEEENNSSPDVAAEGDTTGDVSGEYTSGSDIKLFFGDFSFAVLAHKKFQEEADLIRWAQQWFRRMRENFILASGTTIGTETLMSRQKHKIEGVSPAYVGDYYFTKVRHLMTDSGGYICDFSGRRVVP